MPFGGQEAALVKKDLLQPYTACVAICRMDGRMCKLGGNMATGNVSA